MLLEFSGEVTKVSGFFNFFFLKSSEFLSFFWSGGSFLGMILMIQVLSGFFLVFYYSNSSLLAFFSIQYIMFEVNYGWFFRLLHFNNVSFFFLIIFFHLLKGVFFFSFRLKEVWLVGVIIIFLLMLVSFLGYVLVWAQMSFWAGVVITGLLSVIPFFGFNLMFFFWGSFLFSFNSLKFFFFLHFIIPFVIIFFVFLHIFFLHFYSSSSKIFLNISSFKVKFFSVFWYKDLINLVFFMFLVLFFFIFPFNLGDTLMFEEVNNLVSPIHIVPEWYFLFAYAILRAIPNKLLGVFFLILSVLIFLIFLFFLNYLSNFDFFFFILVFFLIMVFFFLGYLGSVEPSNPFVFLGLFFSFIYFFIFFLMMVIYIFPFFLML